MAMTEYHGLSFVDFLPQKSGLAKARKIQNAKAITYMV